MRAAGPAGTILFFIVNSRIPERSEELAMKYPHDAQEQSQELCEVYCSSRVPRNAPRTRLIVTSSIPGTIFVRVSFGFR